MRKRTNVPGLKRGRGRGRGYGRGYYGAPRGRGYHGYAGYYGYGGYVAQRCMQQSTPWYLQGTCIAVGMCVYVGGGGHAGDHCWWAGCARSRVTIGARKNY
jgi:hypothetical protein